MLSNALQLVTHQQEARPTLTLGVTVLPWYLPLISQCRVELHSLANAAQPLFYLGPNGHLGQSLKVS